MLLVVKSHQQWSQTLQGLEHQFCHLSPVTAGASVSLSVPTWWIVKTNKRRDHMLQNLGPRTQLKCACSAALSDSPILGGLLRKQLLNAFRPLTQGKVFLRINKSPFHQRRSYKEKRKNCKIQSSSKVSYEGILCLIGPNGELRLTGAQTHKPTQGQIQAPSVLILPSVLLYLQNSQGFEANFFHALAIPKQLHRRLHLVANKHEKFQPD